MNNDASTPQVREVMDHLADHFHGLDDSDEPPFGEYARVMEWDVEHGYMVVWHETEDRGVRIRVEEWTP